MSEPAGLARRLRQRFMVACAVFGWLPLALFAWYQGGKAAAAYAAAFLLVAGDFLWISNSFGALFAEGQVGRGVARRVAVSLMLRLVLLILGFYAILHLLSGGALAITAGIVVPLALLTGAGAFLSKG